MGGHFEHWVQGFGPAINPITGGLGFAFFLFAPLVVPTILALASLAFRKTLENGCLLFFGFGPTVTYLLLVLLNTSLLQRGVTAPIEGAIASYLLFFPQYWLSLIITALTLWRGWGERATIRKAMCTALVTILLWGSDYSVHFNANF